MQPNPQLGRAAYEPNSFTGADRGPRADAEAGFRTQRSESGPDPTPPRRVLRRPLQPGAAVLPQPEPDRAGPHRRGLAFELAKVETAAIRTRMLANLVNVDEDLVTRVANTLRMPVPPASPAAMAVRTASATRPSLSILRDRQTSFAGRKLGILVTDGADAAVLDATVAASPRSGDRRAYRSRYRRCQARAVTSRRRPRHRRCSLGPFDAVALVTSTSGAAALSERDLREGEFVADAFAHLKFIGSVGSASALLDAAQVPDPAAGVLSLTADSVQDFVTACMGLREWPDR